MDADVYWLGRHVGRLREVTVEQPYYLGEWVPADDPPFAAALAAGNGVPVVLQSRDGADAAPAWALVGPLAPGPGVRFRFGTWRKTRPQQPRKGDGAGACPPPYPPRPTGTDEQIVYWAERGVARRLTQAEADRHDALTARGWALTKPLLVLRGPEPSARPGWYSRWRLRRAIRCFERALEVNPESWWSMWALGKIYQRLGEQATAFDWFARAHAIRPGQPDLAREGGIAALLLGRAEEALTLCRAAVSGKPDDAGLVCNLALAYCLAGQDADAELCAADAAGHDTSDGISYTVLGFIREVAAGKRQRPRQLSEAFPYG
jgi:tetratricopeptide (TPR) repeat protein